MYAYALVKMTDAALVLPKGIVGELHLLGTEDLGAIVEPALSITDIQQDDELLMQAVLHHDQVIRAVFQQTPLLPLRFGTQFTSAAVLLAHLQAEADTYLSRLAHLADNAEYTLKLIPQPMPEEPIDLSTAKGRDYFLAKKQRYQAQQDWLQRQATELTELQQAIVRCYPTQLDNNPQDGQHRWHILAPQPAPTLLEQVKMWQAQYPHWAIHLSEALPPYHFV
ncbi:MAG: GvpL/GvpF family gas vesicle protein [Cyanobacteria bacterium]|nr:GvpL/GvpF family gas vesicle protein [Cyanobacteriota bacterium]MDW8201173.1 GvpL/GvpF family gas vesicle protein [Cyanobacteriota bacterium SKYGB_h_bin112]